MSLVLQPGPEQTPLGDGFAGAAGDRREIAGLLDVAASFVREPVRVGGTVAAGLGVLPGHDAGARLERDVGVP